MEFYETILPSLTVFRTQVMDYTVRSAIRRNDFETNLKTLELRSKQNMQDEDIAVEHFRHEIQSESVSRPVTISPLSSSSTNVWSLQDCDHQPSHLYVNQGTVFRSVYSQVSVHTPPPPPPPPSQVSFVIDDTMLAQFLTMDFPYDDVVHALQQSYNNFDLALSYLLRS